jgi:hypothetical protein
MIKGKPPRLSLVYPNQPLFLSPSVRFIGVQRLPRSESMMPFEIIAGTDAIMALG